MEKVNNDQLIGMMSLSEEINTINWKMKQLVEQLHASSESLSALQDMASTLNSKVTQFQTQTKQYKPTVLTPGKGATPSYKGPEAKKEERERIVPTPENYRDYLPVPEPRAVEANPYTAVPPVAAQPLPTAAEITNVKPNTVLDRETGKPKVDKRVQTKKNTSRKDRVAKKTPKKPAGKKGFFGGRK